MHLNERKRNRIENENKLRFLCGNRIIPCVGSNLNINNQHLGHPVLIKLMNLDESHGIWHASVGYLSHHNINIQNILISCARHYVERLIKERINENNKIFNNRRH